MRRLAALAGVAALLAGCASTSAAPDRGPLLRRISASTVLLHAERDGGRRSASGVVVAAAADPPRSWIVTARHFLAPAVAQRISAHSPARPGRMTVAVMAVSHESDLALLVIDGVALPPATLRDGARLGDDIWVVSFPFGRRLTLASGVVSQIAGADGEVAIDGAVRMVDAQASYGTSGGGVFDALTGDLIAVVEGYRTARVTLQSAPERTVDLPVPGGTTVIPAATIRRFVLAAGVEVK